MEYISATGIWYANELPTIKKKKDVILQPIYEAITNSWEAIIEKYTINNQQYGQIIISFYVKSNTFSKENGIYDFDKIIITDNGIGLDDKNYERLVNLRDNRKKISNNGTGRIQYLHFFDETIIESIYKTSKENYKKRKITLSKKQAFLEKNAILRLDEEIDTEETKSSTKVTFNMLLDEEDENYYKCITSNNAKIEIIKHFLAKLCDNKNKLPTITIFKYIDNKTESKTTINPSDIPSPDKEIPINVNYSKLDEKRKIIHSQSTENFNLRTFVQSSKELSTNAIYLVSKGEMASKIKLDNLSEKDSIDGKRYLFLLSGKYIDDNNGDDRGNITLISSSQFKKQMDGNIFPEEVVLLDDIEKETNKKIEETYKEIGEENSIKLQNIKELQQMFLLNPRTVDALKSKIKNTDSDSDILVKIYKSDAEIIAEQDAEIKKQVKDIEALMPTDKNYQNSLNEKVNEFVRTIPLQNRTALSQYIARRKLVLDIFGKVLNKELDKLRNGERIDEDILHNLIFQQSSENAEDSDLWLINEEYIYFKGFSEHKLEDIEYNGKKVFDKQFSNEDQRYLNSLGEKRLLKRPDILLFPEEGKCIIIEFKAPEVNVSEHLNQIDFYASLLRNYTIDELQITSFYGYLIGENIEDRDVRGRVSRFEFSPKFNFWFKPSEKVIDFNNGNDGNIYTEIIKFSSLLERAKLRNKIFIDKLEKGYSLGLEGRDNTTKSD